MEDYVKTIGGVLGYVKVNEDMTFKSSLDKFMTDEVRNELKERLSLKPGNVIFIIADKEKCAKCLFGKGKNASYKEAGKRCMSGLFGAYEEICDNL
jgi:aspartyl-tRNA synthetase